MHDSIIKGTGNSRFLKSQIPEGTTHDALISMLRSGTLPVDVFGSNPAGWDVVGTALNKANLLTDETAARLGLQSSAVPNDAFEALSSRLLIETAQYTGTGQSGPSHRNTLTFAARPSLVILYSTEVSGNDAVPMVPYVWGASRFAVIDGGAARSVYASVSGKTMEWYSDDASGYANRLQFNIAGVTYNAIAISVGGQT